MTTNNTLLIEEDEENFLQDRIIMVALTSMFLGIAHGVISGFFRLLIVFVCNIWKTVGSSQGQKMDSIVSKGFCELRELNHSRTPGNGIHIIWIKGPVVAIRGNSYEQSDRGRPSKIAKYNIYCLRFTYSSLAIQESLLGPSNKLSVKWRESSGSVLSLQSTILLNPYQWQLEIAEIIYIMYKNHEKISVLICGFPGSGKTTMCNISATVLKDRLGVQPDIRKGYTLETSGFELSDLPVATYQKPVILAGDEIDCTISHAEKDNEKSKKPDSLAHNPSTLLNTLDLINDIQYLIFLTTSNKTIKELSEIRHGAYIRKGRINIKFQIEKNKKTGNYYLKKIENETNHIIEDE
jgi:hypothetical protein